MYSSPMYSSPSSAAWRPVLSPLCHPHRAALRRWLCDEGSLTARLQAHSQNFAVQVLRQQLAQPQRDERALLGIRPRRQAWVREVLLMTEGKPRIFAHSVLARNQSRGPWQLFARMGEQPLGAALFAHPSIHRQTLHFRCLDTRHPLYRLAVRAAALDAAQIPCLWARRSLFTCDNQSLLVCEVFLPSVFTL